MISSVPSARSSATRQTIFEVPMSRPTMRFLFSLAMGRSAPSSSGTAQRKAVGVAQVDVLVRALSAAERRGIDRDEARAAARRPGRRRGRARGAGRWRAAAARRSAARAPRAPAPCPAARQRRRSARYWRATSRFGAGAARRTAAAPRRSRPAKRSPWVFTSAAVAPARQRHVLLQRDLQAVGPDAAHRRAAHPRQLLEGRAHRRRGRR